MTAPWQVRRIEPVAGGVGLDVHELDSGRPGPTVLVLGGVHGDEVGAIVAAGQLTREPVELRAGRLRVVPVTHEAAYAADSRVGPDDGLNLARVFPGRADGSATERLAHLVTEELLRAADVVVDLHTSSPGTDMAFFVGCLDDGSDAATRAVRLALAFGAPVVWTHATLGDGRSLSVAHALGIPAIYAESPVGGVLEDRYLDGYVDGVRRVLAELAMVTPVHLSEPDAPLWLHGDGDVDAFQQATVDGVFRAEVALTDAVRSGEPIGTVIDPVGRVLETLRTQQVGYVVTLRRAARVTPGTTVVGLAEARPERLGLPSDAFVSRPVHPQPRNDQ